MGVLSVKELAAKTYLCKYNGEVVDREEAARTTDHSPTGAKRRLGQTDLVHVNATLLMAICMRSWI